MIDATNSHLYLKRLVTEYLDKKILKYPEALNFMANDICNSKCIMCNIWKRKKDKEIKPIELQRILNDKLFKKLSYIGISGGEPTLRDDLPDIVKVAAQKKEVRSVGIITNAIQADKVIQQVNKCAHECDKENVDFNVMVSLDGIGEMHDLVRGREGNFENAIRVIKYIRDETNIPLSIGCTIVKENVWQIDEVLEFCIQENIYVKFRIAEFIDRLYNDDLTGSIRSFDDDEKYHIALFFLKLEHTYEKDRSVKSTYSNIRQMIFEQKKRQSGCPYQVNAVVMDCRGNLLYCSPKSPVLGSCDDHTPIDLYKNNIAMRNNVIQNNCDDCVHDYHALPKRKTLIEAKNRRDFVEKFNVDALIKKSSTSKNAIASTSPIAWLNIRHVLIIGWYGTETAGDKAILAEVIKNIKEQNINATITVSSLYPFVTIKTLRELGCEDVKVIDTYSSDYKKECRAADIIMMAGGPLMHIETLGIILYAFIIGNESNKITVLEGCGIGPLDEDKYILAVKEIIRLASVINVRDVNSLNWVLENTNRKDAKRIDDPAINHIRRKRNSFIKDDNSNKFCCFFRELTKEYIRSSSEEDFARINDRYMQELASIVVYVNAKTGLNPQLLPMHTFFIGNDDRQFNRKLNNGYLKNVDLMIDNKIYSVDGILENMSNSKLNICTRYHSVVFSETLNIPYLAIDYTNGGKVWSYLNDIGKLSNLITLDNLLSGEWKSIIDKKISQHT